MDLDVHSYEGIEFENIPSTQSLKLLWDPGHVNVAHALAALLAQNRPKGLPNLERFVAYAISWHAIIPFRCLPAASRFQSANHERIQGPALPLAVQASTEYRS